MPDFAVLDPSERVDRSYFLEASAGTGKTFTIEHLVVRQLLEMETSIDRILVVTFTKKATRELKVRIRGNIVSALDQLQSGEIRFPYLENVDRRRGMLSLEQSLLSFEEAQIFTIHSFCLEMLSKHQFAGENLQPLLYEQQEAIARDYFRIGLSREKVSPAQLAKVTSEELPSQILSARPLGRPFMEHVERFQAAMRKLDVSEEGLSADFERYAEIYTGLKDLSGIVKPMHLANVEAFAQMVARGEYTYDDLDYLVKHGCLFLDVLARGKLRAKAVWPEDLQHPFLLRELEEELGSVLDDARSFEQIVGVMASDVQQLLDLAMEKRALFTFDGLLSKMAQASEDPTFATAVRSNYDVAIVDEFQDTDLLQWSIFKTLFVHQMPFVVVGDPKQSIYAFRSADVYCYLDALDVMGHDCRRTLGTNYRSRPGLIGALNALFAAPGWLPLPKRGDALPYEPVQAGRQEDNALSQFAAVTFLAVEGEKSRKVPSLEMEYEQLFPHIANEMVRLALPWSSYAILVSDRYQGQRVQRYLEKLNIPSVTTRGTPLSESLAPRLLRELLEAIAEPSNRTRMRLVLAGPIFGWSSESIVKRCEGESLIELMESMESFRQVLVRDGIAAMFEQVVASEGEGLLKRPGGEQLLSELYQVVALVAKERSCEAACMQLLEYELQKGDEAPKLRPANDDQAVQILTTFASKGLEYDVVFALAMASRPSARKNTEDDEAERARLFYVALTRACDRVYIPVIECEGDKTAPVELFLSHWGGSVPSLAGVEVVKLESTITPRSVTTPITHLQPPAEQQLILPVRIQHSFTALTRTGHREGIGAPHDYEVDDKRIDTLPAGSETGIVLHDILERIPFSQTVDRDSLRLETTRLADWEEVITDIVQRAVTQPLNQFRLCDVNPAHQLRETEFLYPCDGMGSIGGRPIVDGTLGGFIDLFFYHNDRYYLLDWKSNWLPNYDQETLHQAMVDADYLLQARIYVEALRRYLKVTDGRPFEEIFGGVYYLFLRGLDGVSDRGVFFWRGDS